MVEAAAITSDGWRSCRRHRSRAGSAREDDDLLSRSGPAPGADALKTMSIAPINPERGSGSSSGSRGVARSGGLIPRAWCGAPRTSIVARRALGRDYD